MKKSLRIKIYGKVQGVNFRSNARMKAEEMRVKGYAQNMPDGSVEIQAEGEESDLLAFSKWCKSGPDFALVEKFEISFSNELEGYDSFDRI